jgi:putative DNA primase/helicase
VVKSNPDFETLGRQVLMRQASDLLELATKMLGGEATRGLDAQKDTPAQLADAVSRAMANASDLAPAEAKKLRELIDEVKANAVPMVEHLRKAIADGCSVHPLHPYTKVPILRKWQQLATRDWATALQMWEQYPDANIGVVPGKSGENGWAVIDVDQGPRRNSAGDIVHKEGNISLAKLDADPHLERRPSTRTHETPSGGMHLIYSSSVPTTHGKLGKDLDVISEKGCVVWAGSRIYDPLTKTVRRYVVKDDSPIADPGPTWRDLMNKVANKRANDRAGDKRAKNENNQEAASGSRWDYPPDQMNLQHNIDDYDAYLERAPLAVQGQQGSKVAFKVACEGFDRALDKKTVLACMVKNWAHRCAPPWETGSHLKPDDDLAKRVESAWRNGKSTIGCKSFETRSAEGRAAFADTPPPPDQRKSGKAARAAMSGIRLQNIDEVEMLNIEWLWPSRLARRKHTMLAGPGGMGKSQLACNIAATLSTRGNWPNNEGTAPRGTVLILTAEDDLSDTLVPRLIAAGADTKMIKTIEAVQVGDGTERKFSLLADIANLKQLIEELGDVVLVIIDPITSYLGSDEMHSTSQARNALDPLNRLAMDTGVAILSISHLNKSKNESARSRVTGSTAMVDAPRAAFMVGEHRDEEGIYVFAPLKNNIARAPRSLTYSIENVTLDQKDKSGNPIKTTRLVWGESTEMTANDLTGGAARAPGRLYEAKDFLRHILANGARPAKEVQEAAAEEGISQQTLRRARKDLRVKTRPNGYQGASMWSLPNTGDDFEHASADNCYEAAQARHREHEHRQGNPWD